MPKRKIAILVLISAAIAGAVAIFFTRQMPPDILLITVDTLRADALSIYGNSDSRTPVWQRLAATATVFERAVTPMPLTRPAHFSLFTGLHPRQHGVLNNATNLPDDVETLAEILAQRGYQTAGYVGVRLLGKGSGAEQGFQDYSAPERKLQVAAPWVVSKALAWLSRVDPDRPIFLWVHLFDPHQPYDPPDEFRHAADAGMPFRDARWDTLDAVAREHDGDIPRDILDYVLRLYRGEVEHTDQWLGKLIDGFAESRDLSNTLLVATADHGECFENGIYFEHADCLFEGAMHVPLLIDFPDHRPSSRQGGVVSLLDIMPTILSTVGITPPEGLTGSSLDKPTGEVAALIQHPFYERGSRLRRQRVIRSVAGQPVRPVIVDTDVTGLVDAHWKYIRWGETETLFALKPAPAEGSNVVQTHRAVTEARRASLKQRLAAVGLNLRKPGKINRQLLESLRALGYVD